MSLCEICRQKMLITTAQFDLGGGIEELDVEVCKDCELIHVDSVEYKVIAG